MRLEYMPEEDESLRRFQGLIRKQLAEDAKDYERIIRSLPTGWVDLLTQNLEDGVRKGVNTWEQRLTEGLTVRIRLDFVLGSERGD